jgi:hypothetical protein
MEPCFETGKKNLKMLSRTVYIPHTSVHCRSSWCSLLEKIWVFSGCAEICILTVLNLIFLFTTIFHLPSPDSMGKCVHQVFAVLEGFGVLIWLCRDGDWCGILFVLVFTCFSFPSPDSMGKSHQIFALLERSGISGCAEEKTLFLPFFLTITTNHLPSPDSMGKCHQIFALLEGSESLVVQKKRSCFFFHLHSFFLTINHLPSPDSMDQSMEESPDLCSPGRI